MIIMTTHFWSTSYSCDNNKDKRINVAQRYNSKNVMMGFLIVSVTIYSILLVESKSGGDTAVEENQSELASL